MEKVMENVIITGACGGLGSCLTDEFMRDGCSSRKDSGTAEKREV